MHLEPATSIIEKLGGLKAVAEATGVSVTSVQRWRYEKERGGTGGSVPHWHIMTLMALAVEIGVDLKFGEFFRAQPESGKAAA